MLARAKPQGGWQRARAGRCLTARQPSNSVPAQGSAAYNHLRTTLSAPAIVAEQELLRRYFSCVLSLDVTAWREPAVISCVDNPYCGCLTKLVVRVHGPFETRRVARERRSLLPKPGANELVGGAGGARAFFIWPRTRSCCLPLAAGERCIRSTPRPEGCSRSARRSRREALPLTRSRSWTNPSTRTRLPSRGP